MTFCFRFLLCALFTCCVFIPELFAKPRAFEVTRKIKKSHCVYEDSRSKWLPARKKKSGLYSVMKRPKKKAKNFSKKLKNFKKRNRVCKRQPQPNALSLDKFPGNERLLAEVSSADAVSGTPPSYPEISEESALSLYWREVEGENVITALQEGTPSAAQCDEFFIGANDGESGGLIACEANIDSVRALVKPLEAGISACYLRNLATEENLEGGGISLVRGSFPAGHVANLYIPPTGSESRIVKMEITGDEFAQNIFVRTYSEEENSAAERSYRVDLWFCDGDQTSGAPGGIDQIQVGTDNSFSASSVGLRDGQLSISVDAQLAASSEDENAFEFDPSEAVDADIIFVDTGDDGEEVQTRSAYRISVEDGVIDLAKHDLNVGSGERNLSRFILEYLGGMSDLAMTQGAGAFRFVEGEVLTGTGSAAFEYRDSAYLVTETSEFLSSVQEEDFSEDFFTTDPAISVDTTGYDCGATADVVVSVDMSAETMQAIDAECNSFLPEGTRFCESDAIQSAEEGLESCP
ncbi:hypothetical protein MRY87_03400 [bacterium]|nr:hypothetical protein [bacterium]